MFKKPFSFKLVWDWGRNCKTEDRPWAPHREKVAGSNPAEAFLWGVGMFSLCMHFLWVFHRPKTCMWGRTVTLTGYIQSFSGFIGAALWRTGVATSRPVTAGDGNQRPTNLRGKVGDGTGWMVMMGLDQPEQNGSFCKRRLRTDFFLFYTFCVLKHFDLF